RRGHRVLVGAWSSGVCSSDLGSLVALGVVAALVGALVWWDARRPTTEEAARARQHILPGFDRARATEIVIERPTPSTTLRHEARSEERRVGKEGRSGVAPWRA